MKKCKFVLLISTVLCVMRLNGLAANGDSCSVSFDSGSSTLKNNNGVSLLSGGTSADGDGDVVQLGYYDAATVSSPFAGNFVALTGQGSLNTAYNTTSIGDFTSQGGGAGTFFLYSAFTIGSSTTGNSLPLTSTIPLSIKIFNNTTVAGSTYYNVVSDASWVWPGTSSQGSSLFMSLDDLNLQWYSVVIGGQAGTTAFDTTVALIPEPTSMALLGAGMLMMGSMVRRRS